MKQSKHKEFAARFREAVTQRLWDQWNAIGAYGFAAKSHPVIWAIDPEALILASSRVFESEPRIRDVSLWWVLTYGGFVSIARLKRMQDSFGFGNRAAMADFAETLLETNPNMRSWKAITNWKTKDAVREATSFQRWEASSEETFLDSPKQLLRLRSLFGVTSRAEIVLWLFRLESTLSELSANTVWYQKTVQKTVYEMKKSGYVEECLSNSPTRAFALRNELWKPFFPQDFSANWVVAQHLLYQGTFEILSVLERCDLENISGQTGDFLLLESLREAFPSFQKAKASRWNAGNDASNIEQMIERLVTDAESGDEWPSASFEADPRQLQTGAKA